jgi:hypothetical protein
MANWLELADAEFLKMADRGAAKTAKTRVSAATAAVHPAGFQKNETVEAPGVGGPSLDEQAKLDAHRGFPGGTDNKTLSCDLEAGEIVAVEIVSEVLAANIWLAFRQDFDPGDGKAVFFLEELELLKDMSSETLREIHRVKLAIGGGSRQ